MRNMNVQRALMEDANAIAVLFDQYRQFYQQPTDFDGALKFISDRLSKNESVIFIATEKDKLVGFTQLYPIFSSVGLKRSWLLNDLFVIKGSRGKGIASALLQAATAFGLETNSRWLMLQTALDNHAAQALYEKNGWEKDNDFCVYNFALDK